jgi:hypothetical protein
MSLPATGAGGTVSTKPEFSADIVSVDGAGRPSDRGRLFVTGSKVRIEASDAASGFFLIDGELGNAWFIRPAEQLFMDARQSTTLTQLFVRVDSDDPCRALHEAALRAAGAITAGQWSCERSTDLSESAGAKPRWLRYRIVATNGQPRESRIDVALQFPVKWRYADGTVIELAHIRLATQPQRLFALPVKYRKLDPGALVERIRHSDVWANPPQ